MGRCLLTYFILPVVLTKYGSTSCRIVSGTVCLGRTSRGNSTGIAISPRGMAAAALAMHIKRPMARGIATILAMSPSVLGRCGRTGRASCRILPRRCFACSGRVGVTTNSIDTVPDRFEIGPCSGRGKRLCTVPMSLARVRKPISAVKLSSGFVVLLSGPLVRSMPFVGAAGTIGPTGSRL